MRIVSFLRSPTGNIALLCAFVAVGGLLVFRGNARERSHAAQQMTRVESTPLRSTRETIARNTIPFRPTPAAMFKKAGADETPRNELPPMAVERRRGLGVQQPAKPAVLPISLFTTVADTNPGQLSKTYAPYGRLIPCET